MNQMPLITIVVPVHNSEKYLQVCLESLRRQTYKKIEVICVDDFSKDDTLKIVHNLIKIDDRFRIINDKNGSYGHKINVGFKNASGDYCGILESDDELYLDAIEKLVFIINKYHPDIAGGNLFQFIQCDGVEFGIEIQKYNDINHYNRLIICQKELFDYAHGAIYTALYKKSFIDGKKIMLNETLGAAFQDQGFSFLTDILAESCYHINEPVYKYRRDNAESSVYAKGKIFEISWEMDFIKEELRKRKISNKHVWEEYYTLKYRFYLDRMLRLDKASIEEFGHLFRKSLDIDSKDYPELLSLFTPPEAEEILAIKCNQFKSSKYSIPKVNYYEGLYNVIKHIGESVFCLVGAGNKGKELCSILRSGKLVPVCFMDNSPMKIGKKLDGITIREISSIADCKYIITSAKYAVALKKQLMSFGVNNGDIAIY